MDPKYEGDIEGKMGNNVAVPGKLGDGTLDTDSAHYSERGVEGDQRRVGEVIDEENGDYNAGTASGAYEPSTGVPLRSLSVLLTCGLQVCSICQYQCNS